MKIKNYDPPNTNQYLNKHVFAPKWPFRLLICGPSGSGKTNFLMALIFEYLYYNRIYLFAKHLSEDKYEMLQDFFDEVHKKIRKKYKKNLEIAFFSDELVDIIDDLDPDNQNLIIYDDFLTEKDQESIEKLFIAGRKKNASIIYLSQKFHDTPSKIRSQCNYFAFFRIRNPREFREISQNIADDIDIETLKSLYRYATKEPYHFLFVDKRDYNYRKDLDEFLSK